MVINVAASRLWQVFAPAEEATGKNGRDRQCERLKAVNSL
jgi:hypothetical protein